jgi:hypothetical protein
MMDSEYEEGNMRLLSKCFQFESPAYFRHLSDIFRLCHAVKMRKSMCNYFIEIFCKLTLSFPVKFFEQSFHTTAYWLYKFCRVTETMIVIILY